MARSIRALVEPAPPEAAAALSAALAASDFTLTSLFTRTGNVMGYPETLAAAAAITRPLPKGVRRAAA